MARDRHNEAVAAVLSIAASLVERGWTRDAFARDAAGAKCSPLDDGAVSWSAWGALERAAWESFGDLGVCLPALRALEELMGEQRRFDIVRWSDEAGQALVVSALRRATALSAPTGTGAASASPVSPPLRAHA